MATQRVNFFPKDYKTQKNTRVPMIAGAAGLTLAFAVLIYLTVQEHGAASIKKSEVIQLEGKLNDVKREVASLKSTATKTKPAPDSTQIATKFLDGRIAWSNVLKELSLVTPPGSWLNSLTSEIDKDEQRKLVLTGEAPSAQMVSIFFQNLERSFHFRDAKIKYSERLEGVRPRLYRFQFEVPYQKREFGRAL